MGIIETGSDELGREIEMLSRVGPPYRGWERRAKAIKEPKRVDGVMENPKEQNASQRGPWRTGRFSRSGFKGKGKGYKNAPLESVIHDKSLVRPCLQHVQNKSIDKSLVCFCVRDNV